MAEAETPPTTKKPAKCRISAAEKARRAALAVEHAAQIEEHQRHFGESFDAALERVVAEQDEIERLLGVILTSAA